MKRLTCEMCGSTELLKQDGVFVCQTCGTKYSVEEAKKMMVEGTVEVAGTVKVDQSHLIENFLDMARSAIASGNNSEAEQYCNKVIEIDPNNYKAFLYKGTATAWQSTFANIRILETINCWKKAFANCDKENRTEFLSYTDAEFGKIVIAMVNLAGSFIENGITDYKGNSYREHLLSILNCVELYSKSINPTFRGEDICCEAAISVIPYLMKCAQAEEHLYHKIKPSGAESYSDFIKEYLGCIDVLNMTATFGQKDEAKALCYEKAAEVMQTINDLPFYIWSNGRYEPHRNPNNSYGSTVAEYRGKAAEARRRIARKLEEETKKKRDEFWSINSKEHKALTQELQKTKQQRDELIKSQRGYNKVKLLDSHISEIETILADDRKSSSQLKKSEKDFIQNFGNFWGNLSSNDEYDIYLDQNPVLKQERALVAKRESLLNTKREIENTQKHAKPDALLPASLVAGIGVFLTLIGIFGEMTFAIVLGVLFTVGAIIGTCIYLKQYRDTLTSMRSKADTYTKDVLEYNETIDKMLAVPKFTGNVSNDAKIKIPQKLEVTSEIHQATSQANNEKRAKIRNKIILISAIVVAVVTLILVSYFVIYPNSLKNSGNFNAYITYIEKFDVEHFEIPEGTTTIPDNAFKDCRQLRSITIPSSVTEIGKGAFSGCNNLTSVYISDLKAYCEIKFADEYSNPLRKKYSYSYDKSTYLYYNGSLVTDLIVPEGTTKIGDYAFCYYDNLRSVTIPDSVKSIGKTAFREIDNLTTVNLGKNVESIGEYAFIHCDNISSISIPENLKTVGTSAFYSCDGIKKVYITDIEKWCSISFEDGSTPLENGADLYLNGNLVTNLTIPNFITDIGQAFAGCTSIENITFHSQVKTISNNAFRGCKNIKNVVIPNSVESIGCGAFGGCDSIASLTIPFVGASANDDEHAFLAYIFGASSSGYSTNPVPSSLKTVIVTGGTKIGGFARCTSITSITLPSTITSIRNAAFSGCTGLTSITLPDGVIEIGNNAFERCSNMTSINMGNKVQTIGTGTFHECRKLANITLSDSLISIGGSAFEDCTALKNIVIPASVKSIGRYAFSNTYISSVRFENPNGWHCTKDDYYYGKDEKSISSTQLSDASKAAQYLKSTYYNYYWERS